MEGPDFNFSIPADCVMLGESLGGQSLGFLTYKMRQLVIFSQRPLPVFASISEFNDRTWKNLQ